MYFFYSMSIFVITSKETLLSHYYKLSLSAESQLPFPLAFQLSYSLEMGIK